MQESNEFVQLPNGEVHRKIKPDYRNMTTFAQAQRERDRIREIHLLQGAVDIPFNKIPKIN